jgi:hypothetical protein
MAFADPITPFFSFVDGTSGIRIIAFLRQADQDGRSRFEILDPNSGKIELDSGSHGFWSPKGGILTIDGEVSATTADVDLVGRYLVIEKDGSGTIETDGGRHLEEGEILVTQGFLDTVPVGERHPALARSIAADVHDGAGPDDDLDAVGINSAGLGRP